MTTQSRRTTRASGVYQSRIGKRPDRAAEGRHRDREGRRTIEIKGPKGTLSRELPPNVNVKVDAERRCSSRRPSRAATARAFKGSRGRSSPAWSSGVAEGYTKTLQLVGTGYRAELKGTSFNLASASRTRSSSRCPQGVKCEIPGDSKGTIAHPHGFRQRSDGPDGREDPRLPAAGAVRRQGRALPGREGPREGGQGREGGGGK